MSCGSVDCTNSVSLATRDSVAQPRLSLLLSLKVPSSSDTEFRREVRFVRHPANQCLIHPSAESENSREVSEYSAAKGKTAAPQLGRRQVVGDRFDGPGQVPVRNGEAKGPRRIRLRKVEGQSVAFTKGQVLQGDEMRSRGSKPFLWHTTIG